MREIHLFARVGRLLGFGNLHSRPQRAAEVGEIAANAVGDFKGEDAVTAAKTSAEALLKSY